MTFHFRLMRRSLFDQVGPVDDSVRFAEDYDLCLKLSEITEIYHLQKPLYYYRVHRKSVSREHSLAQIDAAARAIRAAMVRRKDGSNTWSWTWKYSATFRLRPKA